MGLKDRFIEYKNERKQKVAELNRKFDEKQKKYDEKNEKKMLQLKEELRLGREQIASQKEQAELVARKESTETEKLAKKGNILIKGFALWYILPAVGIALIALLFFGVWVWDSIMSLF